MNDGPFPLIHATVPPHDRRSGGRFKDGRFTDKGVIYTSDNPLEDDGLRLETVYMALDGSRRVYGGDYQEWYAVTVHDKYLPLDKTGPAFFPTSVQSQRLRSDLILRLSVWSVYWVCQDGKKLLLPDILTSHLSNIIPFVERKDEGWLERRGDWLRYVEFLLGEYERPPTIEELKDELRSRTITSVE